jgi:hypothetical protein
MCHSCFEVVWTESPSINTPENVTFYLYIYFVCASRILARKEIHWINSLPEAMKLTYHKISKQEFHCHSESGLKRFGDLFGKSGIRALVSFHGFSKFYIAVIWVEVTERQECRIAHIFGGEAFGIHQQRVQMIM